MSRKRPTSMPLHSSSCYLGYPTPRHMIHLVYDTPGLWYTWAIHRPVLRAPLSQHRAAPVPQNCQPDGRVHQPSPPVTITAPCRACPAELPTWWEGSPALATGHYHSTVPRLSRRTANLMGGFQMNGRLIDPQRQSIIVEMLLIKKNQDRLKYKLVSRISWLQRCVCYCYVIVSKVPFPGQIW